MKRIGNLFRRIIPFVGSPSPPIPEQTIQPPMIDRGVSPVPQEPQPPIMDQGVNPVPQEPQTPIVPPRPFPVPPISESIGGGSRRPPSRRYGFGGSDSGDGPNWNLLAFAVFGFTISYACYQWFWSILRAELERAISQLEKEQDQKLLQESERASKPTDQQQALQQQQKGRSMLARSGDVFKRGLV